VLLEDLVGVEAYVIGRDIILDSKMYPQRRNFRFCHELAHIILGHSSAGRLDSVQSGKIFLEQEKEADKLAVELMIPPEGFKLMARHSDLREVKQHYPHASWEVVARRWCEVHNAVLTIYDNGKMTRRVAPDGLVFPRIPTAPEKELFRTILSEQRETELATNELIINGYYIKEDSEVLRVILTTRILTFDAF